MSDPASASVGDPAAKVKIIVQGGTMEAHFILVIYLMLFFFAADFAQSFLVAIHKVAEPIMPDLAATTWKPLFFIAMGMFRGMEPK